MTETNCTNNSLILGKHSSVDRLLEEQQGTAVAQIMVSPSDKPSKGPHLSDVQVSVIKRNCKFLVVHGKNMYNMCNPQPWMFKLMEWELREANRLGADLVIHQGKNVNKLSNKVALETYVKNVSSVLAATRDINNKIILENSARQGTEVGYSLSELTNIYHLFSPEHQLRLGFCLDTCHTFVAGEIDMRKEDCVKQALDYLVTNLGIDKVRSSLLIHLNDSNIEFGGKNDNHANFGVGFITNPAVGGSWEGIRELVRFAEENQIPMILETKSNIALEDEISMIMCLLEGREPSIPVRYRGMINAFKMYAEHKHPDYRKTLATSGKVKLIPVSSAPAKKKISVKLKTT